MEAPLFVIYNARKREFVSVCTPVNKSHPGPAGGLYLTYTPSPRRAKMWKFPQFAHSMAGRINAQLGEDVCRALHINIALGVERENNIGGNTNETGQEGI